MEILGENICFIIITAFILGGAFLATFLKDITSAAFSLFFTLFGIAGYYILLNSDFIAVTQVMVYVGGVLILIIFGILLTNRDFNHNPNTRLKKISVYLTSLVLFSIVLWPIITSKKLADNIKGDRYALALTSDIGEALTTDWIFNFILAGIVLLLILIASAFLIRRNDSSNGI
ncbi:MAG: NADH-quinone oxidoreductase subunit J [Deltaproteobacteria bacterium]|jgi:NADH-quinone oxidoreductase subunit J|nr:NADH-quinone oxidoreductase subunit J [Deltaproteobacteria bacterium]